VDSPFTKVLFLGFDERAEVCTLISGVEIWSNSKIYIELLLWIGWYQPINLVDTNQSKLICGFTPFCPLVLNRHLTLKEAPGNPSKVWYCDALGHVPG
jgi:hypothetical protein